MREDKRRWVEEVAGEMEVVAKCGDSKRVWQLVRRLGGGRAFAPSVQPKI